MRISPSPHSVFSRRDFVHGGASLAGLALVAPAVAGAVLLASRPRNIVTGRKLRIAQIGVGNKGYVDVMACAAAGADIVALCDVDAARGNRAGLLAFHVLMGAARYRDYRQMLTELDDRIDAVVISTPDHTHFPAALMAIERGKHSRAGPTPAAEIHVVRRRETATQARGARQPTHAEDRYALPGRFGCVAGRRRLQHHRPAAAGIPDEGVCRSPPTTIPRVPRNDPYLEWITACAGGPTPGSNIVDHAADLTEIVLLGNIALRLGQPIEWDPVTAACVGTPEANRYLQARYRLF